MLYVTIVDSHGAELGYGGPPHPISHRVLFADDSQVFGRESLGRLFQEPRQLTAFLQRIRAEPAGSQGNLSWEHG